MDDQTECLDVLLAIRPTDTMNLNQKVDAAVDAYLIKAGGSNKTAERQKLAIAFGNVCPTSKLTMRIKTRILHS
jgi:hypothetical protein